MDEENPNKKMAEENQHSVGAEGGERRKARRATRPGFARSELPSEPAQDVLSSMLIAQQPKPVVLSESPSASRIQASLNPSQSNLRNTSLGATARDSIGSIHSSLTTPEQHRASSFGLTMPGMGSIQQSEGIFHSHAPQTPQISEHSSLDMPERTGLVTPQAAHTPSENSLGDGRVYLPPRSYSASFPQQAQMHEHYSRGLQERNTLDVKGWSRQMSISSNGSDDGGYFFPSSNQDASKSRESAPAARALKDMFSSAPTSTANLNQSNASPPDPTSAAVQWFLSFANGATQSKDSETGSRRSRSGSLFAVSPVVGRAQPKPEHENVMGEMKTSVSPRRSNLRNSNNVVLSSSTYESGHPPTYESPPTPNNNNNNKYGMFKPTPITTTTEGAYTSTLHKPPESRQNSHDFVEKELPCKPTQRHHDSFSEPPSFGTNSNQHLDLENGYENGEMKENEVDLILGPQDQRMLLDDLVDEAEGRRLANQQRGEDLVARQQQLVDQLQAALDLMAEHISKAAAQAHQRDEAAAHDDIVGAATLDEQLQATQRLLEKARADVWRHRQGLHGVVSQLKRWERERLDMEQSMLDKATHIKGRCDRARSNHTADLDAAVGRWREQLEMDQTQAEKEIEQARCEVTSAREEEARVLARMDTDTAPLRAARMHLAGRLACVQDEIAAVKARLAILQEEERELGAALMEQEKSLAAARIPHTESIQQARERARGGSHKLQRATIQLERISDQQAYVSQREMEGREAATEMAAVAENVGEFLRRCKERIEHSDQWHTLSRQFAQICTEATNMFQQNTDTLNRHQSSISQQQVLVARARDRAREAANQMAQIARQVEGARGRLEDCNTARRNALQGRRYVEAQALTDAAKRLEVGLSEQQEALGRAEEAAHSAEQQVHHAENQLTTTLQTYSQASRQAHSHSHTTAATTHAALTALHAQAVLIGAEDLARSISAEIEITNHELIYHETCLNMEGPPTHSIHESANGTGRNRNTHPAHAPTPPPLDISSVATDGPQDPLAASQMTQM